MATTSFPNVPGVFHSVNDGGLRIERATPGQKITVLGVTTADVPINEPTLLRGASTDKLNVTHPANGTLPAIPSELNRGLSECNKGIAVEYVKIAHAWGEEGFAWIDHADFNGHIITMSERYEALQASFDLLLNHNMDMVHIPGIYADKSASLSELLEEDNVTPLYTTADGDFAYQLADFCDDSTAENQSCMSGIGRMPIRIRQFYEALDTDYFSLLNLTPKVMSSSVAATKKVTFTTAFAAATMPFRGSSLVIHYPNGTRTYTVDSVATSAALTVTDITLTSVLTASAVHGLVVGDAIVFAATSNGLTLGVTYYVKTVPSTTDFTLALTPGGATITTLVNGTLLTLASVVNAAQLTLVETPLEHVSPVAQTRLQTFDTATNAYDNTLLTAISEAYRRAFRGYHPTDLTSTNKVTLFEFSEFLTGAENFTDMLNLDGTTVTGANLLPDNYRMWKATGGAAANPNGSTSDVLDSNNSPIDLGKWLSMGSLHGKSTNTFGDQTLKMYGFGTERLYASNGIGEYLALALKLPENVSTTNKPTEGFIAERDIRRSVMDSLIGKRYIITTQSPDAGFVIAAGNTAAYMIDANRRSDYVFLTTVRITAKTLQGVRKVVYPYIGRALNSTAFKAMQTDLRVMYEDLVRDNYIAANYDFQITQSEDQRVLGHASLMQIITPAFELRKVFGETNLKK